MSAGPMPGIYLPPPMREAVKFMGKLEIARGATKVATKSLVPLWKVALFVVGLYGAFSLIWAVVLP